MSNPTPAFLEEFLKLRLVDLADRLQRQPSKVAANLAVLETAEKDHGRLETRRYYQSTELDWFADRAKWPGLQSVGMAEAVREIGGQRTVERRCYLAVTIQKTLTQRHSAAGLDQNISREAGEGREEWKAPTAFDCSFAAFAGQASKESSRCCSMFRDSTAKAQRRKGFERLCFQSGASPFGAAPAANQSDSDFARSTLRLCVEFQLNSYCLANLPLEVGAFARAARGTGAWKTNCAGC